MKELQYGCPLGLCRNAGKRDVLGRKRDGDLIWKSDDAVLGHLIKQHDDHNTI